MGFFTKDTASGPTTTTALAPLSLDRVVAAFERNEWNHDVEEDGDVITGFNGGSYWIVRFGEDQECLQVRGLWRGELEPEQMAEAAEFCREWNAERMWPKAFAHANSEGRVLIAAEHNVDYTHGLTDDQLDMHLHCGIGTSEMLFSACSERFPDGAFDTED